jgi:hypothetical protein
MGEVGSIAGVNPYDGVLTYGINQNQFNGQTLASVSGTELLLIHFWSHLL